MLNVTQISTMSPEKALVYAHNAVAVPSLIILFLSIFFIFLLIGIKMVNNTRKFVEIWAWSFFLSLIVLLSLIFLPLATQGLLGIFS